MKKLILILTLAAFVGAPMLQPEAKAAPGHVQSAKGKKHHHHKKKHKKHKK